MSGLARRVLSEARAVEAHETTTVGRGAFAAAAAPDIRNVFRDPVLGGVDQGFAGTTRRGVRRRFFDAALGKCQLAEFCILRMKNGMTDFDRAVAWTSTRDEGATAGVFSVHANSGAGVGAAGLSDAALDVGCTGAVAGFIVALRRAVTGALTCTGFSRNGA